MSFFLKRVEHMYAVVVYDEVESTICFLVIPNPNLPYTSAYDRHWLAVHGLLPDLQ